MWRYFSVKLKTFSFLLQLDEFRKKRAAKKAASSSQAINSDDLNGKQPSENEHVRANELNGVSTSDGIGGTVIDTSTAGMSNDKSLNLFTQNSNQGSLTSRTSPARNDLYSLPTSLLETHANIDELNRYNASGLTGSLDLNQNSEKNQVNDIYKIHAAGFGGVPYGTTNNETISLNSQENKVFDSNTSQSTLHGMNQSHSNKSSSSLKDYTVNDHGSSYFTSKMSHQNSVDTTPQTKPTNSSILDSGYLHGSLYGGNIFSP